MPPDESRDYVQLFVHMAQDLVDDMLMMERSKTERGDALAPAMRAAVARIDKAQLVGVAVPLRERNALLLAAGFAPEFAESSLDALHFSSALERHPVRRTSLE